MPDKNGPVIILADPQMGENIGACARAMLNCGLSELRLVRPRDGWPNERADAMSAGALSKMPPVQVFDNVKDAIADCHYVAATTARTRDQNKPVLSARELAPEIHMRIQTDQKCAVLFGSERAGLDNDDVALANVIVTIPLNPEFSSLNLAQAVLLVAYEYSQLPTVIPAPDPVRGKLRTGIQNQHALDARLHGHENLESPAPHAELDNFLERLETELEAHHFFRNEEMRPAMVRNIANVYKRAGVTEQEVRTLQGMLSALIGLKGPLSDKD